MRRDRGIMGLGDKPKVRDRHDRQRKKKARELARAAERGAERKAAKRR
jgi:hypothetical protein